MKVNELYDKLERLNQRLRILILQNSRQGSIYDSEFLLEVHGLSREILRLKHVLGKSISREANRPSVELIDNPVMFH